MGQVPGPIAFGRKPFLGQTLCHIVASSSCSAGYNEISCGSKMSHVTEFKNQVTSLSPETRFKEILKCSRFESGLVFLFLVFFKKYL